MDQNHSKGLKVADIPSVLSVVNYFLLITIPSMKTIYTRTGVGAVSEWSHLRVL